MNYFKDCKTKEEAKTEFRKLAKQLHPDHGGRDAEMIDLQKQFDAFEEPKDTSNKYEYFDQTYRKNIYEEFHKQNQGNPYFTSFGRQSSYGGNTYTFHPDNDGELNSLRKENISLKHQLQQSKQWEHAHKTTSESYARANNILEQEVRAHKKTISSLRMEKEELKDIQDSLINSYPRTPWGAFKLVFKLIGKWFYNDFKSET